MSFYTNQQSSINSQRFYQKNPINSSSQDIFTGTVSNLQKQKFNPAFGAILEKTYKFCDTKLYSSNWYSAAEEHFFCTLSEYIGRIKYAPDRNNLTILNVGCGSSYGTEGLAGYFSNLASNFKIYGIDPDPFNISIKQAKSHYENTGEQVKFIKGHLWDVLAEEPLLKNNADIVLIRHPDINISNGGYKLSWFNTFVDGYDNVRKNGLMIFTTWEKEEMDTIRNFLNSKGLNMVVDEKNCLNNGIDNYIMILKKTNSN